MPHTSHRSSKQQQVTLLGFGAIGRAIYQRMAAQPAVRISAIVVRPYDEICPLS